jgi:DNA-directed RNA polymerase specialized sigma24 family protein
MSFHSFPIIVPMIITTLKEKRSAEDNAEDLFWVREVLAGSNDAFKKLIQKHQESLFSAAYRILKSQTDAYEVVQEGFIEAYRHLSGFKQTSRFSTWLHAIVLNRIHNKLRSRKTTSPKTWAHQDLNLEPTSYEPVALTN